ncbi:MAG: hypothetical protein WCR72_13750 [Bacteroidota bacterium]
MNSALKSTLWWIFAIIFTVGIAAYQRMTGPTYPAHGSINLNQHEIKYKLIRTAETDKDAPISITVPDTSVSGNIIYKRFKSPDTLSKSAMVRTIDTSWDASFANLWRSIKKEPLTYTLNSDLKFMMPRQPAAGKMEYSVNLTDEKETVSLTDHPVVMRFKGPVPLYILLPHILLMFLAMLFSTRAGIEALIKGKRTYLYALLTLIFFIPGGLILGPVVQKFAFDAYWTGWPFGHDLTDNKTALAVLGWLIAVIKLRKNPTARNWAIAAAIILLAVYMVPHSVLGSEIDYTQHPK